MLSGAELRAAELPGRLTGGLIAPGQRGYRSNFRHRCAATPITDVDDIAEPRGPVELVIEAGPDSGRNITVAPGRHLVGRGRRAAVRLADPLLELHHALFDNGATRRMVQLTGGTPWMLERSGRQSFGTDRDALQIGDAIIVGSSRIRLAVPTGGGTASDTPHAQGGTRSGASCAVVGRSGVAGDVGGRSDGGAADVQGGARCSAAGRVAASGVGGVSDLGPRTDEAAGGTVGGVRCAVCCGAVASCAGVGDDESGGSDGGCAGTVGGVRCAACCGAVASCAGIGEVGGRAEGCTSCRGATGGRDVADTSHSSAGTDLAVVLGVGRATTDVGYRAGVPGPVTVALAAHRTFALAGTGGVSVGRALVDQLARAAARPVVLVAVRDTAEWEWVETLGRVTLVDAAAGPGAVLCAAGRWRSVVGRDREVVIVTDDAALVGAADAALAGGADVVLAGAASTAALAGAADTAALAGGADTALVGADSPVRAVLAIVFIGAPVGWERGHAEGWAAVAEIGERFVGTLRLTGGPSTRLHFAGRTGIPRGKRSAG